VIADAAKRRQATALLSQLAALMPQSVVERAKRPLLK